MLSVAGLHHSVTLFLLFALVFQSCTKDEFSSSGATQNLAVYLTDDPAQFDKVLVQINSVEVKLDTGEHRGDDARTKSIGGESEEHGRAGM